MRYDELPPAERARLVAAYGAGLAAGSGGPWMLDDSPEMIALIDAIADDWFRGLETWQATRPPWTPEWLRAEQERAVIADARPPESWLTRTATDGKP